MKEKPSLAPNHIIHAAAEYAREWANLESFAKWQKRTNDRAERKRRSFLNQNLPERQPLKIGEDEELEKTPSQVIEDMRKSRGQPTTITI